MPNEMIEDDEPYYGEVPGLKGVWATGATLEVCRHELAEAIEDWLLFSIAKGLPIPRLEDEGNLSPFDLAHLDCARYRQDLRQRALRF